MTRDTAKAWDNRYKTYGSRIEGVLQKSFPLPINEHIHQWMLKEIEQVIPRNKKCRILDIGCGWGRLSEPLVQKFPKCKIFGVDISQASVALYNQNLNNLGKAYRADVRKLPFGSLYFDVVFMVTTLMYLTDKKEQKMAIKEIFRVLKKGGRFVFIERNPLGQNIVTLGGMIEKMHGKKNREISASSFYPAYLSSVVRQNGGMVRVMDGVPFWTITLPISLSISLLSPFFARKFLSLVAKLDSKFTWLLTPSLYISYIGVKK